MGETLVMPWDEWKNPGLVREIIDAVFQAGRQGRALSTDDLKNLDTLPSSPEDLVTLVDELVSSGHLLGRPYGGGFDHFFEHADLRLGLRAINELQRGICERHKMSPLFLDVDSKVGVAANISDIDVAPLNGLRHPPVADTSGWYLWRGGEIPQDDPGFFEPLHATHLSETSPDVLPYLGLPPGWRFLLAPGQEEVWHDPSLLDVQRVVQPKKLPAYVVIDSTVLIADIARRGNDMRLLLAAAARDRFQLVVPEIVIKETLRRFASRRHEAELRYLGAFKALQKLVPARIEAEKVFAPEKEALEVFEKDLLHDLNAAEAAMPSPPDVDHSEIVKRILEAQKPSGADKDSSPRHPDLVHCH